MTKPIALDITAIAEMNFMTGVQRVVRQFIAANREDIEFIRYDIPSKKWRSVPELGRIVLRERSGAIAQTRAIANKATTAVVEQARSTALRRVVRNIPFARVTYTRFKAYVDRNLQAQKVEISYKLSEKPEWTPSPDQTYIMMDIPVMLAHMEAMQRLFDERSIRSLIYLHDLFPLSHRHLFDRGNFTGVRMLHLEYLDAVSEATEVVTNSEFTFGQYTRFCDLLETGNHNKQKRSVVYLPRPNFEEGGPRDDTIAERFFGDSAIRLLLIGQLDIRKNFKVVVAAVKTLIDRGVDARLGILAGFSLMNDPALARELETCTDEQRSRITIEGAVSDAELLGVYDAVNIVAVPSLAEGYGLPVVEAISRGKRVIAANATALPELAGKFPRDTITIVDPHDAAAWADAIERVAAMPPLGTVTMGPEFPVDWRDFRNRILAPKPSVS